MDTQHISIEHLKRTKMICTIGPATSSYDDLDKLIHIGMNVARLNFSHGTYEEFEQIIHHIRELAKKHEKPIAIVQDLQGPKIRVGKVEKPLSVKSGDIYYLGQEPDKKLTCIPIQYNFIPYLEKEHAIFMNDGYLKAIVKEVHDTYAIIRFLNDGTIISNKGINIPDTLIDEPCLTKKDLEDLNFGLQMDVDYIALSFVQKAEDITYTKEIINKKNPLIKVISKIETKNAIQNIDAIIAVSDAIMIARGDLAVEVGIEKVPVYQMAIIEKCKEAKKPVIVATQMLESMIENPRPTRAEVSDVANAAIAETDAVMLSAESAVGKYPFNATELMRSILKTTENNFLPHQEDARYRIIEHTTNPDAIAAAATLLANNMNLDLVAVATESGKSALAISSLRPHKIIIAVTQSEKVYNQLALVWGIKAYLIDKKANTIDDLIDTTIATLEKTRYIGKGSKIVFVTGLHIGVEGETNSLRILDII